MEKKTILLASAAAIIAVGGAWAQSGQDNFYQDILISDEIKQQDAADSAQKQAAQILQEDNTSVQSEAEPLNVRSNSVQNAAAAYGTAPFGLTWGISKDEAEQMGIILTPTDMKDYVNAFSTTNLPDSSKEFMTVVLVFGEDNRLWRILAHTNFITGDDEAGNKTLKLYQRFYNLLSQKYGNAQQFYTDMNNPEENATTQPDQNPNLLHDLELGDADLYATFEGDNVGVALGVNVDGDMQSYLLIDYKNLKILKENEVKLLNSL